MCSFPHGTVFYTYPQLVHQYPALSSLLTPVLESHERRGVNHTQTRSVVYIVQTFTMIYITRWEIDITGILLA